MTAPLAWLYGSFVPLTEARLPLNDAGFIWGATVTDLLRTFARRPYRLADHLHRFRRSCDLACVPQPYSNAELTEVVTRLLEHNGALIGPDADLAVVVFATPGPVGYYLGADGGPGDGPPTVGVHTFPLPLRRYQRLFREGARLAIPTIRHVPRSCVDPNIKQRSRLHWWLAEQEVRRTHPGASALLCDLDGFVTETAAANFLIVRDGAVLSPPSDSILQGISWLMLRELCAEMQVPFVERRLPSEECRRADEAMLTSTPYCLAGVRSIDGVELTWPGPLFQRLLKTWSERIGRDIAGQILTDNV
jgi:branched-subunit amino acid aminotransferase/4-amino-4-deoxychorismate lyase